MMNALASWMRHLPARSLAGFGVTHLRLLALAERLVGVTCIAFGLKLGRDRQSRPLNR
jgi:hypothetical protein